jgi:competence ComEA-like helix-hairpin-helix protein
MWKSVAVTRYIFLLCFPFTVLFASIDINSASSEELLVLNGIGTAKAAKIVNYRDEHKCFNSVEELANVDGISQKIIDKNKKLLVAGPCQTSIDETQIHLNTLKDVLLNPVNLFFVVVIFILAVLEYITKKDLKSQIISVGVLGTFVGIFIGLQGFDPQDIMNSVKHILVGLKTAFFTSIVGMSVATILSITQKLRGNSEIKQ